MASRGELAELRRRVAVSEAALDRLRRLRHQNTSTLECEALRKLEDEHEVLVAVLRDLEDEHRRRWGCTLAEAVRAHLDGCSMLGCGELATHTIESDRVKVCEAHGDAARARGNSVWTHAQEPIVRALRAFDGSTNDGAREDAHTEAAE